RLGPRQPPGIARRQEGRRADRQGREVHRRHHRLVEDQPGRREGASGADENHPLKVSVAGSGATGTVCSLPPCGGGLGRGVAAILRALSTRLRPPPPTAPHKGEGSAPSVWRNLDLARAGMLAIALIASACVVVLLVAILWLSFTDGTPGDPNLGYTFSHYVD